MPCYFLDGFKNGFVQTYPFIENLDVFFGYPTKNINTPEIATNAEHM